MSRRAMMTDHYREQQAFLRRVLTIAVIVLLLACALIVRLAILQISNHPYYQILSEQNQLNFVPLPPTRGLIYDRNGILLADNLPVFNLEITPEYAPKGVKETVAGIKQFITLSDDEMLAFNKQMRIRRRFEPVPIKMRLNDEEVAAFAVNSYQYPGVHVAAHMVRYYPYANSLAHVLGYVGRINEKEMKKLDDNYSATNFIGKVGLENFYEETLHGQVGYQTIEVDASGRVIRTVNRIPPKSGYNLHLTLDLNLQFAAEKALGEEKGAVVAINPNDGSILAFASHPSYDPNVFVHGISNKDYQALRTDPAQPLYNRAVRGQYPIASTIKPYIALGAIDKGYVNEQFKIADHGIYYLPGSAHVWKDWKKGGHGIVNISKAVMCSCDIYFYTVAHMMGIDVIADWIRHFGFGTKTNIDMNEELAGNVPDSKWKLKRYGQRWYAGDTISAGIGQSYMLTTPLQMANAVSTMSMKGKHFRPHLMATQERVGEPAIPYQALELPLVQLNHPENWDLIQNAMRSVITDNGGTGYRFGRDAPYAVAAKTGTAQVYSAKRFSSNYNETSLPVFLRDHSLFIAFAPMDQPSIAVAVVVENSHAASHVARVVLDTYFGVQPKETVAPTDNTVVPAQQSGGDDD